jgi:hypothetical protein
MAFLYSFFMRNLEQLKEALTSVKEDLKSLISLSAEPTPAPAPAPAPVEPAPAPAPVEPTPAPVAAEPTPEPTPAPVEPTPEPAPAPAPVEPAVETVSKADFDALKTQLSELLAKQKEPAPAPTPEPAPEPAEPKVVHTPKTPESSNSIPKATGNSPLDRVMSRVSQLKH